jgi:hypothetical protein
VTVFVLRNPDRPSLRVNEYMALTMSELHLVCERNVVLAMQIGANLSAVVAQT